MSKKEIIKFGSQSLIIFLMVSFVVSAVFPDYSLGLSPVPIEEADMDEQESSEEKKENKENKENIQHHSQGSSENTVGQENIIKHPEHSSLLQELFLPVITPPPDYSNDDC